MYAFHLQFTVGSSQLLLLLLLHYRPMQIIIIIITTRIMHNKSAFAAVAAALSTQIRRQHFSHFAVFFLLNFAISRSATPSPFGTFNSSACLPFCCLLAQWVAQFSCPASSLPFPLSLCPLVRLSFHVQLCAWIYDHHTHTHTDSHRTWLHCLCNHGHSPLVSAVASQATPCLHAPSCSKHRRVAAVRSSIKYENLSIILCNTRQLLNF